MEEKYCLFDKYQIEEIFYKGLESEEHKEFVNKISSMSSSSHTKDTKKQSNNSSSEQEYIYKAKPMAAKNPMSASQMKAKYGVTKESVINVKGDHLNGWIITNR